MDDKNQRILDAAHQAELLGKFKIFCEALQDNPSRYHEMINILSRGKNKKDTLHQIFKNNFNITLKSEDDEYMLKLVEAFFRKRKTRIPIPDEIRLDLLREQNGLCVFCKKPVNIHDPVDHIVPFKYVGDELEDNYQILCQSCNSKKNKKIDYQIKVLLNL